MIAPRTRLMTACSTVLVGVLAILLGVPSESAASPVSTKAPPFHGWTAVTTESSRNCRNVTTGRFLLPPQLSKKTGFGYVSESANVFAYRSRECYSELYSSLVCTTNNFTRPSGLHHLNIIVDSRLTYSLNATKGRPGYFYRASASFILVKSAVSAAALLPEVRLLSL